MNYEYYFKKYADLALNQDYNLESMNYAEVEKHIFFLKQLATVENSSVGVVDVYKQNYVFVQSKFLASLGMSVEDIMKVGQKIFFSIMHPNDVPFVIETHCRSFEFLLQLPVTERKKYKTIYDFRLKDKNGEYIRFIQQVVPIELDANGSIWLMLLINDIVSGTSEFKKQQRRLVNIETGKLYLYNDEDELNSKTILSKREIEILGLLAKGMASKNIADELSLSVNTVNNHRRNILEKTDTYSTAGAVRYAISLGLM